MTRYVTGRTKVRDHGRENLCLVLIPLILQNCGRNRSKKRLRSINNRHLGYTSRQSLHPRWYKSTRGIPYSLHHLLASSLAMYKIVGKPSRCPFKINTVKILDRKKKKNMQTRYLAPSIFPQQGMNKRWVRRQKISS